MDPRIEKIFKLPAKIRALIMLGVVVAIVVLFYFLLYAPRLEEYNQLAKDYAALDAQVQEKRRIAANLSKFQAEYQRMQDRLKEALTELPNEKEIDTLLTNIAMLAKDQGMEILRFRPLAEVPKGFYNEVPVQLSMVGTYHQAALFFHQVGQMSRIVNIGNLTLANPQASGDELKVSVDCLATTFRFVDKPPAQDGKKKAPAKKKTN